MTVWCGITYSVNTITTYGNSDYYMKFWGWMSGIGLLIIITTVFALPIFRAQDKTPSGPVMYSARATSSPGEYADTSLEMTAARIAAVVNAMRKMAEEHQVPDVEANTTKLRWTSPTGKIILSCFSESNSGLVVKETVEAYLPDCNLKLRCDKGLLVNANRDKIDQCYYNLVENVLNSNLGISISSHWKLLPGGSRYPWAEATVWVL